MRDDDVVSVLQRAKERIAEGWCQGMYTTDERIRDILSLGRAEGGVCIQGAIYAAAAQLTGTLPSAEVWSALVSATGCQFPSMWNDDPGRTQADVLDMFDRAQRLAKEAGA